MKKATGIVLAVLMLGVMLTGCYTRACGEPPVAYKGEG